MQIVWANTKAFMDGNLALNAHSDGLRILFQAIIMLS